MKFIINKQPKTRAKLINKLNSSKLINFKTVNMKKLKTVSSKTNFFFEILRYFKLKFSCMNTLNM